MASLLGNVGYNFAAFALGRGAAALVSIVLLRMLGPAGAGIYSAALGFAFLFSIAADLGLATWVTREVSGRRGRPRPLFMRAVLVQGIQVVLAAVLVAAFIASGGTGQVSGALVAMAFAGVALAVCANLVSAGIQGLEDFRAVALLGSACSWLNALVLLAVVLLAPTPLAALTGWMASNVAGFALWIWAGTRRGLVAFRLPGAPRLGGVYRGILPFALLGAANQFYLRQGVVLLAWMVSAAQVGLYAAAARLSDLMVPLLLSLSGPLYPRIAFLGRGISSAGLPGEEARGKIGEILTRALRYLGALCIPVGIGGTLLARPLMLLLFGAEFAGAGPAFAWLVWVPALTGMHCAIFHVLNALHRTGWVAGVFGFNAAFALAANLVLVPRYGFMAVPVIAVACEVVVLAAWLLLVARGCRIPLGLGRWLFPSLPASLLMAGALALMPEPRGWMTAVRIAGGGALYLVFLAVLGFFGPEERRHIGRIAARFGWGGG